MTTFQESNARAKLIWRLTKAYTDYHRYVLKAKQLGIDDSLVKRIQAEVTEELNPAKPKPSRVN